MRPQLRKIQLAGEAPAATDDPGDPMSAMDYDDMEHASAVAEPALATPHKHRKRTRRLRVEAEQIVSMAFPADILDGFADIHGDGGRRVTRLSCANHRWQDVGDLAWVVRVMRHQYSTGGIPPLSKGDVGNTSDHHNVWWGFRDSAWLCRAKYAGRTYVKTLGVTRRAQHNRSE